MADPQNRRDDRRDDRALAALFVLLALLAAWQLGRDETPDLPATLALPLARPAARAGGGAAADFAEIVERPLFSQDRGRARVVVAPAPAAAAVPETAPAAALEGWTLVGMTSQGDRVVALVRQGTDGPTRMVRSGDLLGDWAVLGSQGLRALLLERDGEQAELTMAGHAGPSLPTSEPK
jgi:hypothetical protein